MREPIHPGETPREALAALGMSAVELARRIEVPVNRITQMLNGQPELDSFVKMPAGQGV